MCSSDLEIRLADVFKAKYLLVGSMAQPKPFVCSCSTQVIYFSSFNDFQNLGNLKNSETVSTTNCDQQYNQTSNAASMKTYLIHRLFNIESNSNSHKTAFSYSAKEWAMYPPYRELSHVIVIELNWVNNYFSKPLTFQFSFWSV